MPAIGTDALYGAIAQITATPVFTPAVVHRRIAAVHAAVQFTIVVTVVVAVGFSHGVAFIVQVFGHPCDAIDYDSPVSLAVAGILHCPVSDVRVEVRLLGFLGAAARGATAGGTAR